MALSFSLVVTGVSLEEVTIADVRVSCGRKDVWSDVEAGSLSVRITNTPTGLNGTIVIGKPIKLIANNGSQRWTLFTGRITDIEVSAVAWGEWEHQITAVGPLADLSRLDIGGLWPRENDSQRIIRIIDSVGYDSQLVPTDIYGPDIVAEPVPEEGESPQQSEALGRALDTAQSGGGLLYEDPELGLIGYRPRVSRYQGGLVLWDTSDGAWDDQGGTWAEPDGTDRLKPWTLQADTILLDPFTWEQHIGDLITFVEVVYGSLDIDDRPSVIAGDLTIPVFGEEVDTLLADQADAQALADRIIAARSIPRWGAPETVVRVDFFDPIGLNALFALRPLVPGRPVDIPALPPGSPYPEFHGFLEGWEHRIIGRGGGEWEWEVELWLSDQALTAPMSTWDQIGVWWDLVDQPWTSIEITQPPYSSWETTSGSWDELDDPWQTLLIGG